MTVATAQPPMVKYFISGSDKEYSLNLINLTISNFRQLGIMVKKVTCLLPTRERVVVSTQVMEGPDSCVLVLALLCLRRRGKLSCSSCWRVLSQLGRPRTVLDVDREKVERIVSPPHVANVASGDGGFVGFDFGGESSTGFNFENNNDFSFGRGKAKKLSILEMRELRVLEVSPSLEVKRKIKEKKEMGLGMEKVSLFPQEVWEKEGGRWRRVLFVLRTKFNSSQ